MSDISTPKDAVEFLIYQAESSNDFHVWPDRYNVRGLLEAMLDGISHGIDLDVIEKEAVSKGASPNAAHTITWCACAIFEEERGNIAEAWSNVLDANFFYGVAIGISEATHRAKNSGGRLANLLHDKTTRKQRSIVQNYWFHNVDHKLSAQKAATVIEQSGITTLSHKKIAEIVSPLRKMELERKR